MSNRWDPLFSHGEEALSARAKSCAAKPEEGEGGPHVRPGALGEREQGAAQPLCAGVHPVWDTETVRPLFGDWHRHFIAPALQRRMGAVYADDVDAPKSAAAALYDIVFLAGAPNGALLTLFGEDTILVPQNDGWSNRITAHYGAAAEAFTRYAMRDNAAFDSAHLKDLASRLPEDCTLAPIDAAAYTDCLANQWSRDLVGNFQDYTAYREMGLGVVIRRAGAVVAGASSYCSGRSSIEIEIDTRADVRRQGLATACGAALIVLCLERGIYPSWDAHDLRSAALAQKLGYEVECGYPAFAITKG